MDNLRFDLTPTQYKYVTSNAHIVQIIGGMGEGKCLKKGTTVLMFNGSIKKVEEIRVGDQLMGDDSTPRNVLSLGHGIDELFQIIPYRGEPFTVNANHILSLKRTGIANFKRGKKTKTNHKGEIVNIEVKEYLKKSNKFRDTHKLYRVPADFFKCPGELILNPYFLGLWLGDGDSHRPAITTPDKEIIEYLYRFSREIGIGITVNELKDNKSDNYFLTRGKNARSNPLTNILRKLNILNNKHIPYAYKINSKENRLELLAGLVDTDGYRNRNSYQFTMKSKQLSEDIAYLCRSLGFAAYIKPVRKAIKKLNFEGTYYQIGISGDLSIVPVKLQRKKCDARGGEPFKNVLVTGIKDVISEGPGEYFGFTIDGNNLFLLSDFTVTHNTFASVAGLIAHAQRCGKDIRAALIRDTFQNIKTSTIPDIHDYLGSWVQFRDGYKKMIIKSTPRVEVDLFGIDDEASISKLQGPQYSIIWIEEPCPIYEKANAGLPREVFNMALARASRQRGTTMRVQISHNPGDADHWSSLLADEPEEYLNIQDETTGEWTTITKKTFWIPKGENTYLSLLTRAANMAAFKDDPAKWQRYVEGQTAEVHLGKKVTPGYHPGIHYADKILPVYQSEALQFWDGWQNPACIIAQYTPIGQLVIHDVLYGEQTGTKELIEERIDPILRTLKYKDKITSWRIIGDTTMRTADQSSVTVSAAKIIEDRFDGRFEPGPAHWHMIKESVNPSFKGLLNNGQPKILLSRSAVILHQALKGGWHYKTDNNGNIMGDKPVKNQHSHPGDAFANGVAVLMPYNIRKKFKQRNEKERLRRAMSYRGGNYSKPANVAFGSGG